jgi:tetratricopeptide (TPR) repeat protein
MRPKRRRSPTSPLYPPAPAWPRDETALLREADVPLALLLWQRSRDVRLWASVAAERRTGLFVGREDVEAELEAGEALADDLSSPFRTLRALVRFPDLVTPSDVCAACLAVAEWCEHEHMPETALHFAEAGALADPMNARAAAIAGAACTAQAAEGRAELWLVRAIRTARRTGDWEWHARAYLRLGLLYHEVGDTRRARRAHDRARASALWSGYYGYAATAHHNLLLVECAAGTFAAGERHARRALELHPMRFSRLPHLAHDVAYLMTCHGAYGEALTLLDVALPFIVQPQERVAVLGTVAKAAAGTGRRERHSEAVADVLLLESVAETHAAAALVLCAEGATLLGEHERARRLAARGLELAVRRKEREAQRRAHQVLDGMVTGQVVPPPADRVAALRALFVSRLRELRAARSDPLPRTDLRTLAPP